MNTETRYIVLGTVILAVMGTILFYLPGDAASKQIILNKLTIATGFTLLALIFLLGFAVIVAIANGSINISSLLCEPGTDAAGSKGASMSRFQLLVFTLVIALSLFLVTVADMKFPDTIPAGILTLLGISSTTFAVSKGIQASTNQPTAPPPTAGKEVI